MSFRGRYSRGALVAGLLAILLALSCPTGRVQAQDTRPTGSWPDSLSWSYRSGDDIRWADPSFDDGGWEQLPYTWLDEANIPDQGWSGIGWFRTRFSVDSTLWNKEFFFRFEVTGAADVFLDGIPIASFGVVGTSDDDETSLSNTEFFPLVSSLTFSPAPVHVLAVRHSNFITSELYRLGDTRAGFWISVISPASTDLWTQDELRRLTAEQYAFTFIPLSFAVLYFLLFAFYREERHFLHFALLASSVAAMTFLDLQFDIISSGETVVLIRRFFTLVFVFVILFLARFIYGLFYEKLPRQFWFLLAAAIVTGIGGLIIPFRAFSVGLVLGLVALLEISRTVVVAVAKRKSDAWIVGAGLFIFVAGILYDLLMDLGMIRAFGQITNGYYYGFTGMVITMAVYLARYIAKTNSFLKDQLSQVRRLSAENLEKEREARLLEVSRLQLEAENERKTQELEDARILQRSMLPEGVPDHPRFEFATYFKPATEVGGDYYDFRVSDDGTVTVAIGDATGHGMRAGTMVTATKSLFSGMDENEPLERVLSRSSQAIKHMGLPKLFMAFALVRLHDHQAEFAGAGMPPAVIVRAGDGRSESMPLKGMPLGSPGLVPYQTVSCTLNAGDTVVLMSDGFPELFNANSDMLGYDKAAALVHEIGSESPQQIIERLAQSSVEWQNGRPQDDDITFVVIRMK